MTFGVTADAVAMRNVIVQLLLEFAGNSLALKGSVQVRSF
jgi:hypothetical protein